MPEQRRKFSPQFKAEAVQMVLETGKPIAEVARDLGINDGTLGNCRRMQSRERPAGDCWSAGGSCRGEGVEDVGRVVAEGPVCGGDVGLAAEPDDVGAG